MQRTRLGRILATGALLGLVVGGLAVAPASAATIGLAVEVASDGNGPFTPDDRPGADSDAHNGIVRTFDAVTYNVTVNANDGAAANERFTVRAPAGTSWSDLPGRCTGAGSGIVGDLLTCNLGALPEGAVEEVPVVLAVDGGMRAGDAFRVSVTATADDATNGPVTESSPVVRVSAAPRYDLSKSSVPVAMKPGVTGPSGQEGIQLRYPVTVVWKPVVAGQGLLGYERTDGTFTFRDDVSGMTGGGIGGPATLMTPRGGQACGLNTIDDFRSLPGGRGGGAGAVPDSGTVRCSQSAPGAPVDVSFTGVDTALDPSKIVSTGIGGGALTGGARPFVVSAYITLWVPNLPVGESIIVSDTFSPVSATSISGQANYPGESEPLANNTATRNLSAWESGSGGKSFSRVRPDGSTEAGSAKTGDPNVTPGQKMRSEVSMTNPGLGTYHGAVVCDVFDRGTQQLARNSGPRPVYASSTGFTGARIEYSAYDFTDARAARDATCGDADGPWYTAPEDVPGGVSAVGKVRVVGDLAGGAQGYLYSIVDVRTAPRGSRAYDFGQLLFGAGTVGWQHDPADPQVGAGPLADSVVIWPVVARVAQKVVDPGTTPGDTPDDTDTVANGRNLRFALYPTLTNATRDDVRQDVTVRVELPAHTTYVDDSASLAPDRVEAFTDGDGNDRQRLVWVLPDVLANEELEPIVYDVAVSRLAPSSMVSSTADVSAPLDGSARSFRTAERSVRIVNASGIGIEKKAVEPVVVVGDRLEWDLTYANTASIAIPGVDLIDVLPYDGGTGSSFHGGAGLAAPVGVDAGAGERVRYTTASPAAIEVDPAAASNQPGGATKWCEAAAFATAGCPDDLAHVTAVRIVRTGSVGVGDSVVHRVAMQAPGAIDGDTFTNRFGLRAPGLALPVQSNRATIQVVSGTIGDRVWDDLDGNGLQDAGEPGVAHAAVALSGTDDRGRAVARTTTTDGAGDYRFEALRPGEYVVHFTAPDGDRFTKVRVGDDRAVDSDAGADGDSSAVELAVEHDASGALSGVSDDRTVDAGVVRADDSGEPDPSPTSTAAPGHGNGGDAGDAGPDAGSGNAQAGAAGADPSGALAFTGAVIPTAAIVLAVLALLLGAIVLVVRRRRPEGDEPTA